MDQEESRELGQALDLFLDEALERILFSNPVDRTTRSVPAMSFPASISTVLTVPSQGA